MKIELKAFQETAARQLLEELEYARKEAIRGRSQAMVLSSPTGSGKTVTVTALMEWIYEGYDIYPGDPDAVFLWISDSPELNQQSRDKIARQSSVFSEHDLVIIEPPFSQEKLDAGKVYFLNIQKLSRESLLTKIGDGREYTIWQTIQNTSVTKPGNFFLILDEAHRGMIENRKDREAASTIVQRFIKGYIEGGMQPIKLILGMSATPERFNRIIEGSGRVKREYTISTDDVKASGLIKDLIVLSYPEDDQPADWSLLQAATQRWQRFCESWRKYCEVQEIENQVEPVMVIQVEDGSSQVLTRTNLRMVVEVVERVVGKLPNGAWAHAFQEEKNIEAGDVVIRKIDASQIEADTAAKVVLFKMSLTTGWDCPRAEVMMSFRKAKDHTLIAQLVGRMVRTPLARTIEGQEFLNSVSLYLPHYDQEGLKDILDRLNNPDPEIGIGVDVVLSNEQVTLKQATGKEELFKRLQKLPTYRLERKDKSSNARRLMHFARQLTFDEIDHNALGEAKALIITTLEQELERMKSETSFIRHLSANQEIEIREIWVEYGEWKDLPSAKTTSVRVTPENIEDLFSQCGRLLGEGLHKEFWKARKDVEYPERAKLELFGILQEKQTWQRLERVCDNKIQQLFRQYGDTILELPSSKIEEYNRIRRIAKKPEPETLVLPQEIEVRKEEPTWSDHLYVDDKGRYGAKLNTWETATLSAELKKPEVIGWLRNIPRKSWALAIPYEVYGDYQPLYPDLIVFRKEGNKLVVDLLDPHNSGLPDAVDKAKGLALYAKEHGLSFGRIELIGMVDGELRHMDLNKEHIRDQVVKADTKEYLDKLFFDIGIEL